MHSSSQKKMMASHQQENTPFLIDALLCDEDQYWDNKDNNNNIENTPNCLMKCQGEGDSFLHHSLNPEPFLEFCDDEELSCLLSKELKNELYNGFEDNPCLAKTRCEAVEWMLKVIEYYSFSALTAVLAVNYLDRFLYSYESHKDKPWLTQLAAVACLSLAAKVEETQVPLLLDLQVEECKYVFQSKTIQRMEILVLSSLEWKMNPVTPLSFLDYIARRLSLKGHLCREFLSRCHFLVISVISDGRFMCYLPSALATAIMLYVISSLEPFIGLEYQDQLIGILGTNKDKVEDCCKLIQEVAISVDFPSSNKRKFGSLPKSPKGIFDVSFSSDSSNDSWVFASTASVSSSPEPLSKKIKP